MAEQRNDYAYLERVLGYTFKNKKLLKQALTHSSVKHDASYESNARIQQLGNTVIAYTLTNYLCRKLPDTVPIGLLVSKRGMSFL